MPTVTFSGLVSCQNSDSSIVAQKSGKQGVAQIRLLLPIPYYAVHITVAISIYCSYAARKLMLEG